RNLSHAYAYDPIVSERGGGAATTYSFQAMRGDPELRQAMELESPGRQPTTNGQATSATFHAVRGDTVLITVAVDNPLLARSVAIQWHGTREVTTPPIPGVCHRVMLDVNFIHRSTNCVVVDGGCRPARRRPTASRATP
uniref:Plastocyanin-like domain-containing protein n=2 Tax=Aegilops tauschii subsp. strangulata TaxID=200361 RepID=A0A452XN49_AEGTS